MNAASFSLRLRNNELISLPKPCVMGVINCSDNSFFNPQLNSKDALSLADDMVAAGAVILDVGGEATNPKVDIAREKPSILQEIDRVVPVIAAIKQRHDVLVSVDTSEPDVMQAAIDAGADMINDQRALQVEGAMDVVVNANIPVCLMHFFHQARVPGSSSFEQLLQTIKSDLNNTVARCLQAGLSRDRIVIDPGFGQGNYGKNADENYYLLAQLNELADMGLPILSGWSRKSMLSDTLGGVPPQDRLYASIASATLAAVQGAAILRVHDVAATLDAIKVFQHMQRMKA